MNRWMWVLVGAGLVWSAAIARADENFEPFPCEHDGDSGSSAGGSSASDDEHEAADVVTDVIGAFVSAGSAESSEQPAATYEIDWPQEIGFRLDAGYAGLDLGPSTFADTDDPAIAVLGSDILVGGIDLAGGELAIDLAPTRHFRLAGGFGMYAPVAGEAGGTLPYSRFGRDAVIDGLTVFQTFVEAGFVQRVGRLHAYAVAHAGLIRAQLDVSSSCGCDWRLAATRIVLGPRLGIRAHLYKSVYLQTALFADALELPDYVATIGLGLGRSAR